MEIEIKELMETFQNEFKKFRSDLHFQEREEMTLKLNNETFDSFCLKFEPINNNSDPILRVIISSYFIAMEKSKIIFNHSFRLKTSDANKVLWKSENGKFYTKHELCEFLSKKLC